MEPSRRATRLFPGREQHDFAGLCYGDACDLYASPAFEGIGLKDARARRGLYARLRKAAGLAGKVTLPRAVLAEVVRELQLHDTRFARLARHNADATELVERMRCVVDRHPILCAMVQALLHDGYYKTIGARLPDGRRVDFRYLARKLVAGVYVLEKLLHQPRRKLVAMVEMYEDKLERSGGLNSTWTAGSLFKNVKGESVLTALNLMHALRDPSATAKQIAVLSDRLEATFSANIAEAVIGDMMYGRTANALAGVSLLKVAPGDYDRTVSQRLTAEWWSLYTTWNGAFCWQYSLPGNMLLFAKLLMPALACHDPKDFAWNRGLTLFWVVRSAQIAANRREKEDATHPFEAGPRQPSLYALLARLNLTAGRRMLSTQGMTLHDSAWRHLDVLPHELARLVALWRTQPKKRTFKIQHWPAEARARQLT